MKLSQFRQLIREEVRKVIKENKKKSLTEAGRGSLYKFIVGTQSRDAEYRGDIEDGVVKMPKRLQDEWDNLMDNLSTGYGYPSEHKSELEFYIQNAKYFSPRLVKMSKDILDSGDLEEY